MNELLAKLVDITYELFGVLIPGLVASVFLFLWLCAAEPLLNALFGVSLDVHGVWVWLNSSTKDGLSVFVVALATWYFLGQILLSFSKHRAVADGESVKNSFRRVCRALIFRIPRSPDNFNPSLKPLFGAVATKFDAPGVQLDWRQFYPVVKSYLSEHLSKSLVNQYQNKYTLHRSITTASTLVFWLSLLTCVGGLIGIRCGIKVNWAFLLSDLGGSLLIVWSFSTSFMDHWQMFGDSVVTEAYSLIYGPKK